MENYSQSGSQNGAQSALLFWPKRLSVPGPSALPCSCTCQDGLDEVALYVTDGDGELVELELVSKGKLDSLLLHLGQLVLVLQDVLDELVLHVNDGGGELEVTEDDLALQEEHLALETVPFAGRSHSGRP